MAYLMKITHNIGTRNARTTTLSARSYDDAKKKAEGIFKRDRDAYIEVYSGTILTGRLIRNVYGRVVWYDSPNKQWEGIRIEKPTTYVITGTDVNGRRFDPIYTDAPQHYHIYRGTLWKLDKRTGKRTKVKDYY